MADIPFFSVITVCRNAEQALGATISSLRAQSFTSYEWIVVDGASTDGTCQIARKHLDPGRDTLVSEPDDGVYFAMNKGLRLAKGSFVLFLNAGDCLADTETLATVHDSLDTGIDVLHGDVIFKTRHGALILRSSRDAEYNIDRRLFASHQSTYVRRTTHLHHPFDTRFRIAADFEALASMHAAGASFRYLPEPLSITTLEAGSISIRGRAKMAWEDFVINQEILGMTWISAFLLFAKTRVKITIVSALQRLPEPVFGRIPDRLRNRIY